MDIRNLKLLPTKAKVGFTLAEGATHVNLLPTSAKVGFTLAEVLITLGIIGVVATLTIPSLINNYQKKQTVTKLQKAISVLNQAYKLAYDDVGEPTPKAALDMGAQEYFKQYWAPYIKASLICTSSQQCGFKSESPYIGLNKKPVPFNVVSTALRTTFYTPDGFLFVIVAGGSMLGGDPIERRYLVLDINGSTGPNMLGKDVFYLTRVTTDGGGIRALGFDKTSDEIDKSCSKSAYGEYCAEKIRRAGWDIDKSYPW